MAAEQAKKEGSPLYLDKLSEEELEEKLSEIKSMMLYKKKEIYTLIQKRSELVREAGSIKKEIMKLREAISAQMQRSESIRKELENYKTSRMSLAEEKRRLYQQLQNIQTQVKDDKDKLLSRLAKLEWIQQTTPLPPDEELAIIDKIAELERKSLIIEKGEKFKEKTKEVNLRINELLAKREALVEELVKVNQIIKEFKKQIRDLMNQLINKSKEIDKVKESLLNAIKEYADIKEEYGKIKDEIVRRRLSIKARVSEKTVDMEQELAKQALEKYKRGEKLDLAELQILYKQYGDSFGVSE
ncbi:MAG TPA: hypothetical protein VKU94_02890 [Geobacterales bacterium]|nr:hypothetical protein [Geobacterales bacterium]